VVGLVFVLELEFLTSCILIWCPCGIAVSVLDWQSQDHEFLRSSVHYQMVSTRIGLWTGIPFWNVNNH